MVKERMSDFLLWTYLFTIIIFSFVTHSTMENDYYSILNKISFIILILFIFINIIMWIFYVLYVNSKIEFIDVIFIGLLLIFMISSAFGNHIIVMESLACYSVIPNCRFINFKKFIFCDFFSKLILFLLVIFLYYVGILHDFNSYLSPSVNNNISSVTRIGNISRRYSLGFVNPNIFAGTFLTLLLSLLVICFVRYKLFNKIRNKFMLIIGLIILLVFINSVSNSQSFDISLTVLIILIVLYFCHLQKFSKILILPVFFITVILSILLPFKYNSNNPQMFNLNYLLSDRLDIQHSVIGYEPISSFGHSIIGIYQGYNLPIDNLPLYTLLFSGIIGFIIYYLILLRFSFAALRCKYFIFSAIFISLFIYSMVEKQPSDIDFMSFLIEPIMLKCYLNTLHKENNRKNVLYDK